jgi:hypothetical protein
MKDAAQTVGDTTIVKPILEKYEKRFLLDKSERPDGTLSFVLGKYMQKYGILSDDGKSYDNSVWWFGKDGIVSEQYFEGCNLKV